MSEIPVQIVLRPYASLLPLACFSFATGNVIFSSYLLHWIPERETHLVAILLLAFVGPLEIWSSVGAFLARDTGEAIAFAIFGASWIVDGMQLLGGSASSVSPAGGTLQLCLVVCLGMIAFVTFKGKPLLGALLVIAIVRSLGAAVVDMTQNPLASKATGMCGLLLALVAFYAAIAFLEEDVSGEISPLTFRSGKAKEAMIGKLEEQIPEIKKEAGVRKQL